MLNVKAQGVPLAAVTYAAVVESSDAEQSEANTLHPSMTQSVEYWFVNAVDAFKIATLVAASL